MPEFYHIGSILSVFLSVLIILKKNKTNQNYILAFWLLIMGVNIFLFHRQIDHNEHPALLTYINVSFLMLQIPMPLVFVKEYLYSRKKLLIHSLLYFSPAIIYIISPLFVTPDPNHISVLNFNFSDNIFYNIISFYILIAYPTSLIIAYFGINKLKKLSLDLISDSSENDFNFFQRFIIGMFSASVFYIATLIVSQFYLINPLSAVNLTIVIISLSVIYLGLFGLQRTDIFTVKNFISVSEPQQKVLINDDEKLKEYLQKLENYILETKIFLRPRLSIKELSEVSGISEQNISLAINTIKNQNFYDFINSYRINEFIMRINSNSQKNYTLTAIAYECGFNSKSTFFAIFKKHTGYTPSQYIKITNKIEVKE